MTTNVTIHGASSGGGAGEVSSGDLSESEGSAVGDVTCTLDDYHGKTMGKP